MNIYDANVMVQLRRSIGEQVIRPYGVPVVPRALSLDMTAVGIAASVNGNGRLAGLRGLGAASPAPKTNPAFNYTALAAGILRGPLTAAVFAVGGAIGVAAFNAVVSDSVLADNVGTTELNIAGFKVPLPISAKGEFIAKAYAGYWGAPPDATTLAGINTAARKLIAGHSIWAVITQAKYAPKGVTTGGGSTGSGAGTQTLSDDVIIATYQTAFGHAPSAARLSAWRNWVIQNKPPSVATLLSKMADPIYRSYDGVFVGPGSAASQNQNAASQNQASTLSAGVSTSTPVIIAGIAAAGLLFWSLSSKPKSVAASAGMSVAGVRSRRRRRR